MRKIKKILSLVMSLVMVVSLFTGIDITSVAEATKLMCDADGDGYTTSADARLVLRYAAKLEKLPDDISNIDIDADEIIRAYDAREILKASAMLVNIENAAPVRTYLDEERYDDVMFNPYISEQNEGTITVSLSAENLTGTQNGNLFFTYDPEVFEFVEITPNAAGEFTPAAGNHENGKISFAFIFIEALTTSDVALCEITFNVLKYEKTTLECSVGTWDGSPAPIDFSYEINPCIGHEDLDEDGVCDNCSESISYIKLTADNTEINSGEEFSVTVSVDNAKGLKDGKVSFAESWADETEYEIVSYEFNDNLTYEEIDGYYFDFSFDETVQSDNVDIVTVTYKPLVDDDFAMAFHVYTSDLLMYEDYEYIWIYTICLHENTTEHPEKDATCTEDGYTAGVYCEDCEEWISGHEWINYYGHDDWDEDGICDNCSGVLSYIRLTADKTEVNPGEEFTVTLSVDNAKGLKDGSITFAHAWWDEYELVSYEFNENLTYFSEYNDNNFIFSFNEAIQSDSVDIATVTYKPLIFDEFSMSFYVRTSDLVMYDDHEYISIDVICSHKNVSERPEEAPSCTNNGYTAGEQCDDCGEWITGHEWIDSLGGHVDEDNDNFCDVCTSPATLKVGENIISSAFGDNKFKFKAEQAGLYKIVSSDNVAVDGYDSNTSFGWNGLMCFSENDSMTFSVNLDHYDEETYFINITLVDDSIKGHSDKNHDGDCDNCSRSGYSEDFVSFEINGSECTLTRGYEVFYLGYRIPSTDGGGAYIPYEECSMTTRIWDRYELWLYPNYIEYDEEYNGTKYAITEISEGAFVEFGEMEYIVIPRTVRTIGDYAVGYTAMSSDAKIENFVIYGYRDSAAEKYAEDNGFEFRVLYDYEVVDDEVVITEVCDLFTIHDIASTIDGYPVTTIGENCFADRELFYLTLPENITTIKAGAFRNNPNLGEYGIEINNTLKTVEDGAFDGCGIVGIAYYGTPEQWSEISIGENNDAFRNAEVTFNGTGHKDFAYIIEDGIVKIVGIDYDADFENLVVPEALDGYTVTELNIGYQDYNSEYNPCDYYQITIPESVTKIREESIGYGYDWAFEDFGLIPGFKIIGVPGSYAETYANENGITFEALPEVPDEPTTEEPTTEEPTTEAPTTEEPTTEEPTTEEPTTEPADHTHDYVTVVTAPTCTEKGFTTYTCACGETYVDDYVDTIGHRDSDFDSLCDNCSVDGYSIMDFIIESNDETGKIVGYELIFIMNGGTPIIGDVISPYYTNVWEYCYVSDTDKTVHVTSIEDGAFIGLNAMKQIIIPASVISIGDYSIGYTAMSPEAKIEGLVICGYPGTAAEEYANENGIIFKSLADEPTTEEPTTEEPTTEEPTTKEPETQAPTTEKPSERPSTDGPATDGPATDGPTEKPVSDKLEVKDDTVKVDNTSKVSTVNTKSSANDILKSVKNEKVSIVDKDGKAISGDALVGTGAKIQIKDNSGKVISTYTVCVPTDVDGNGKTTAADARLALRGSAKLEKVEGVYATASDMNADGKITAADARKILRISAGLE